jgi:hypothetical protein
VRTQVEHLLRIIATECRDSAAAKPASGPVTEAETETVWHLHSTFIYYLVRKHIFGVSTIEDTDALVRVAVGNFLGGIGSAPTRLTGDAGNEPKTEWRATGRQRPQKRAKRRMNGNGRWIDE